MAKIWTNQHFLKSNTNLTTNILNAFNLITNICVSNVTKNKYGHTSFQANMDKSQYKRIRSKSITKIIMTKCHYKQYDQRSWQINMIKHHKEIWSKVITNKCGHGTTNKYEQNLLQTNTTNYKNKYGQTSLKTKYGQTSLLTNMVKCQY